MSTTERDSLSIRLMPVLFVWLWSTGFIGAKYGLPYAEPFTLLAVRMLITLAALGALALFMRARWPGMTLAGHTALVGVLIHGLYLGGVFYAIDGGMPAGLASLIVGLQPLLTSLAAVAFLGERVRWQQWLGLALGLCGVMLVLWEKLGSVSGSFPLWTLAWVLVSLVGISLGTVYQKRFCVGVELIPATFIQYCAALAFFAVGAFWLETRVIDWQLPFVLALGWLVLGLSVGAILLLMALIRRGAASQVASLFYLVPPVTALQAYLLFDERFGPLAILGGLMTVAGVALVVVRRT
ncbi:DMT family transporter [Motiliproteus sediminis]|uniref:DMT family transporter n=1 Tax=Motiliproteus sediminis TaxID=1468178 RepID=UPI001AEFE3C0|nr:DMT family transporter [Motiliproteus sediminis]